MNRVLVLPMLAGDFDPAAPGEAPRYARTVGRTFPPIRCTPLEEPEPSPDPRRSARRARRHDSRFVAAPQRIRARVAPHPLLAGSARLVQHVPGRSLALLRNLPGPRRGSRGPQRRATRSGAGDAMITWRRFHGGRSLHATCQTPSGKVGALCGFRPQNPSASVPPELTGGMPPKCKACHREIRLANDALKEGVRRAAAAAVTSGSAARGLAQPWFTEAPAAEGAQ